VESRRCLDRSPQKSAISRTFLQGYSRRALQAPSLPRLPSSLLPLGLKRGPAGGRLPRLAAPGMGHHHTPSVPHRTPRSGRLAGPLRPGHRQGRCLGTDTRSSACQRRRAGAEAFGAGLAAVPPSTGCHHARLRFLHRRDVLAAPLLRALLHRARKPPCPPRRLHDQSDRCLGDPASAQPSASPVCSSVCGS
jgi:hypothetical protein